VGTPANTRIVDLPVLAGRWLQPGDDDVVVLNHMAAAAAPGGKVGSSVTISVDREPHVWRVVGIVRDLGSPATAYVSSGTFARITHTTGTTVQLGVSTGSQDSAARADVIRRVERAPERLRRCVRRRGGSGPQRRTLPGLKVQSHTGPKRHGISDPQPAHLVDVPLTCLGVSFSGQSFVSVPVLR
jgi:hypothetical protein